MAYIDLTKIDESCLLKQYDWVKKTIIDPTINTMMSPEKKMKTILQLLVYHCCITKQYSETLVRKGSIIIKDKLYTLAHDTAMDEYRVQQLWRFDIFKLTIAQGLYVIYFFCYLLLFVYKLLYLCFMLFAILYNIIRVTCIIYIYFKRFFSF